MFGYKDLIELNDTVILFISIHSMIPVHVTPQKLRVNKKTGLKENEEHIVQTTFGALKVSDLIGKRYGQKVKLSKGFGHVLFPTPELWTKCVPHRTQILYSTDISSIIYGLDIGVGSRVVESGTGTGSLSHSLIRSIAPTGHLFTFDFHEHRCQTAREEFEKHGLSAYVTCGLADVCDSGFTSVTESSIDAVFIDLPHPWKCISHASHVLKKDGCGRICSFSPCIEQVEKTVEALSKHDFIEITTQECLLREFQVRKITQSKFDVTSPQNNDSKDVHIDDRKRKRLDNEGKSFDESQSYIEGLPVLRMPGHTGYLTFATLPLTMPLLTNTS